MTVVDIILWTLSVLVGLVIVPLPVIFLWDWFSAPKPTRVKNFDYFHQSEEDENGIHTRVFTGSINHLKVHSSTKTLYENFLQGLAISTNDPIYGARMSVDGPYTWLTYSEFAIRVKNFGSGLIAKGFLPKNDTFIGIQAQNCVEWTITEQAVNMYSMVIVPLYDTLGVDACNYIVNFMDISVVIVDTKERFDRFLGDADKLKNLKVLISVMPISPQSQKKANDAGIVVASFSEIEDLGRSTPHEAVPPKPTDLCTICCTSGTTGEPKGVMLTHENLMFECSSLELCILPFYVEKDDVAISYLPLAHCYERFVHAMVIAHGGKIGFFTGDVRRLVSDIKELKPTILPAVPRVLGRIYAEVWKRARKSLLTSAILHTAFWMKRLQLMRGIYRTDSVWDKLVFRRVRDEVGGRVQLALTGSAPIEGDILTFLRAALGVPILEGYGQTECVGCATTTVIGDMTVDHVGPPLPGVEIKLIDVNEMSYFAKDGNGEVCIRGKNVMIGYYKLKDKTQEVLDSEGWLHTGDIATWTKNGCLQIIDRKKNLFKLSQGEYVAPEKLEQSFSKSKLFQQVFIDGNSKYNFPVAIIIPDQDQLVKWAHEQALTTDYEKLLKSQDAKNYILTELKRIAKEDGIKSFEIPQAVALFSEPFSVANGMLTPTFKIKRAVVRKKYQELINNLYKESCV